MGHRTVKRVPMDFDAPLNKTWKGYVMPDDVRPPDCPDCSATGYSPTARWLHDTFYNHNVAGESGGWRDKLVQADVDALIEAGRLRECISREPTEDNPRRHEWITVPRTAVEVNAANGARGGMLGDLCHDGINCHVLVKSRCERLSADLECPTCNGHAMIGTPEQLAAYEEWMGTEPPTGDGWQMWETTSEGSPQTPVFATPAELAVYCADPANDCTVFASIRWTAEQWLESFGAGTTDMDSLLVMRGPARIAP